jgi:hypothetical protein
VIITGVLAIGAGPGLPKLPVFRHLGAGFPAVLSLSFIFTSKYS